MSPQLTIITAAMSLGGMASVGFNHYQEVEDQVTEFKAEKVEQKQEVEIAQVGERVETALSDVQVGLRSELQRDREGFAAKLAEVMTELETLKAQQSSHDVLMERLSKDYTSLEFRVEAQSEGFRPLRATEGRFQPLQGGAKEPHPLLPPVEPTWAQEY